MPRTAPYRCDLCVDQAQRCISCRARRAAALKLSRLRKREAGLCVECHRKAVAGQIRCRKHRRLNNLLSAASHASR